MVLTRRGDHARMPITLWFPNEILTDIIICATQSDRVTLCCVSKLFHALVIPILNQHIVLRIRKKCRSFKNLCRALINNPERIEIVRSLIVIRDFKFNGAINYDLLFESLILMQNLERLSFNCRQDGQTIAARLASLTFPNLSSCRLDCCFIESNVADFSDFVARYPSITRFYLRSPGLALPDDNLQRQQGILPNLLQYDGKQLFFHKLCTSTLRAVRLGPWYRQVTTSDVQALRARTDHTVPLVLSLGVQDIETAEDNIVSLLSAGIPNIQSLQLQISSLHMLWVETLKRISTDLTQFRHLAYFAVTDLYLVNVQGAEVILHTWTAACPTLKGCCIGKQCSPAAI
ncbi:hypothetical protein FB45DRAFT_1129522 [Roridomyces roridus]|uniref:F-box domain-containing protein n=1 Tax=Roridomyces roridus TaxID=1738132 RepID=A0AAD7B2Y4_9AGAR|nr:hypothetical protein FB45DRAFT_1129522 [Roridomyces roridus]